MQSIEELVPPEHLLPDYARSRSYTAAGARFLDTAASRGLQPHHRVLDLGCGVGRFAVALAGYLDERGSYVGIDIHKRSIRICQEYIGQKLDNFKFIHPPAPRGGRELPPGDRQGPAAGRSNPQHPLPAQRRVARAARLRNLTAGDNPRVRWRSRAGEANRSSTGMDRPRRGPRAGAARARAHADRGTDPLRRLARPEVFRPWLQREGHRRRGQSATRDSSPLRQGHERFLDCGAAAPAGSPAWISSSIRSAIAATMTSSKPVRLQDAELRLAALAILRPPPRPQATLMIR
ncbi:MAG: class I SAM-dependent methyltransferase [Actinobacteria bacterium]|nr:MAG: class I SAM-dependent methyltransferase [Actinomycetota bacterium]